MTVGAFQGDTVIADHGHLKAGKAEEEPQPFDLTLEVLDPRGRICRRTIGRPRCSDQRSQQPEKCGELRNQPPENHPYVARTGIRFIQVNHSWKVWGMAFGASDIPSRSWPKRRADQWEWCLTEG